MTLEERNYVTALEKRLRDIEQATNPAFLAELVRRLGGGSVLIQDGASATGTTVGVRNAADSGTETVANDYAGVLTVTSGGQAFRIGYY